MTRTIPFDAGCRTRDRIGRSSGLIFPATLHRRLVSICVSLVMSLPAATAAEKPAPGGTAIQGGCGCPAMPAVATSEKPAKGHVHGELRHTDLEAMLSNRHIMFAGDWDDAMLALAHEIDPSGKYKIWDRPAPPIVRHTALVEGGLSNFWLHPEIKNQTFGRPVVGPSDSPWAYVQNADTIMGTLVNTLARINKYGEPAKGLRSAILTITRFITDKLVLIPHDNGDPDAQELWSFGEQAKSQLASGISAARPKGTPANGIELGSEPRELSLNTLDIANAVLDVYQSSDAVGRVFLIGSPNSANEVFEYLIEIASAAAKFGGTAAPGSAQDALACRAFATLVQLADVQAPESSSLRERLMGDYVNEVENLHTPYALPSRLAVTRGALMLTGIGSAEEAHNLVRTIGEQGMYSAGKRIVFKPTGEVSDLGDAPMLTAEVASALHGLAAHAGGASRDTYRKNIAAEIASFLDDLAKRITPGRQSRESLMSDALKDGGAAALPPVSGPCQPAPGKTKARIFLYAITADGLQPIKHVYINVPMIIEAQYDPPSGDAEVEFDVSFGGPVTKMTLKRFDQRGYIYRSDPILPQGPQVKKGDAFDPKPNPNGANQ